MPYEIIYGKQFIDLGNNKYLPLVLMGSNNCTMFVGGREIRERGWHCIFAKNLPVEKEEYTDYVKTFTNNEYEAFKEGSRWVMNKDLLKWIGNCFKNARTIEDILTLLPRQSLRLETVSYWSDENDRTVWNRTNNKYVRTTEEILDYLNSFNSMEREAGKTYYLTTEFSGIEPLKLGKKTEVVGKCIIKYGKDYLTAIDSTSISYCRDITKAMVFESAEKALAVVSRVNGWGFYKAAKIIPFKEEYKEKGDWAVTLEGWYICGTTKKYAHRTTRPDEARRFKTESQAKKYAEKINERFWGTTRVVNVAV